MITAPTQISNCQVWLDASDTTSLFQLSGGTTAVAANLDPVGYWGDKSGNTRHFTNIGGSATTRPTWVSSLSTVRFDGTNDYLSSFFNLTYTAQTVFVVTAPIRYTSAARIYNQAVQGFTDIVAVSGYIPLRVSASGTTFSSIIAGGSDVCLVQPRTLSGVDTFTSWNSGGGVRNFINGQASTSFNLNLGTQTYARHRIAAGIDSVGGAANFFNGDISEVVVYNRALTNNERADVEYYLTRKWNFLNSIPRQTYAIKNGLWSDSATWSISAEPSPWNFPLSADNAYTNTFTVTADSSTRVDTIRNSTLAPNILSGGSFVLANGVSLSAGITSPVTNTTLISSQVTTQSSIIGPTINTANLPSGSLVFIHSGTGTLELSCGRFFYGTSSTFGQILLNTNNGKVILKGDVITGTGSGNAIHYANLSGGNIDIIGNVLHSNNFNGGRLVNSGTGTLSITGDAVGSFAGTSNQGIAILQNGTGSTKILGTVYGANTEAIQVSNGKLELIGNSTSGTYPNTIGGFSGISQSGTGTVSVTGNLIGSNVGGGYSSTVTSFTPLSVYGNIINAPNGRQAIYAPRYQVFPSASATYTRQAVNGYDSYADYWTSNATFTYPASSDVVLSTVYSNNTLSGSMALPPTSSVALGASVGTTSGTASITLEGLLNQPVATLNTSNSIGARLKNVATTQALSTVANSLDFNN
jgi:hypothetical protein